MSSFLITTTRPQAVTGTSMGFWQFCEAEISQPPIKDIMSPKLVDWWT
jgi:hypothetical protein